MTSYWVLLQYERRLCVCLTRMNWLTPCRLADAKIAIDCMVVIASFASKTSNQLFYNAFAHVQKFNKQVCVISYDLFPCINYF